MPNNNPEETNKRPRSEAAAMHKIIEITQLQLELEQNRDSRLNVIEYNGATAAIDATCCYSPPNTIAAFGFILLLAVIREMYRTVYPPQINERIGHIIQQHFEDLESYDKENLTTKKETLERENIAIKSSRETLVNIQLPLILFPGVLNALLDRETENILPFYILPIGMFALITTLLMKHNLDDKKILKNLEEKKVILLAQFNNFFPKELKHQISFDIQVKEKVNTNDVIAVDSGISIHLKSSFTHREKQQIFSLPKHKVAKEMCYLLQLNGIFSYIQRANKNELVLAVPQANFHTTASFDFYEILNQRLCFRARIHVYQEKLVMDALLKNLQKAHGGEWRWHLKNKENHHLQICFFQAPLSCAPSSMEMEIDCDDIDSLIDDTASLIREMNPPKPITKNKKQNDSLSTPPNPPSVKPSVIATNELEPRRPEHPVPLVAYHVRKKEWKAPAKKSNLAEKQPAEKKQDGYLVTAYHKNQLLFFPNTEIGRMAEKLNNPYSTGKIREEIEDGNCIAFNSRGQSGIKFGTIEDGRAVVRLKSFALGVSGMRPIFLSNNLSQTGNTKTYTMEFLRIEHKR